jgi:hypothetical protein
VAFSKNCERSFPDLRTLIWAVDCGSGIIVGRKSFRFQVSGSRDEKAESRERKAVAGRVLRVFRLSALIMTRGLTRPGSPRSLVLHPPSLRHSTRRSDQNHPVMHENRFETAYHMHTVGEDGDDGQTIGGQWVASKNRRGFNGQRCILVSSRRRLDASSACHANDCRTINWKRKTISKLVRRARSGIFFQCKMHF